MKRIIHLICYYLYRCPYCYYDIKHNYYEYGHSYIGHNLCEYEVHCKQCARIVDYYAYGDWGSDLSSFTYLLVEIKMFFTYYFYRKWKITKNKTIEF